MRRNALAPGSIRIGTAGFKYADWKGAFYPARLPDRDMLRFYAECFDALEINYTYYQMPSPKTLEAMARKAGGQITFSVKAHGDMTHRRENLQAAAPPFREAIRALEDRQALGCVLAQFPYSFWNTRPNREHLLRLREALVGVPLVIEFRNASWYTSPVFAFLREQAIGFCCVDEPDLPNLPPRVVEATGAVGYVRFHGRAAAKWWDHTEAAERYDYLYAEGELEEWVPKIQTLAAQTRVTFLFFNNHPRGKAAANAYIMKHRLGLPVGKVPRTLIQQFPALKALSTEETPPGELPLS
ncbi:MAG: DUF72 domain-containing protein [Candidatus Methylomirabilales bacterium]